MSSNNSNLTLELRPKVDKLGKTYYLAKIKGPLMIDCSKGVAFLVFTSEPENEALQICNLIEKDHGDMDWGNKKSNDQNVDD